MNYSVSQPLTLLAGFLSFLFLFGCGKDRATFGGYQADRAESKAIAENSRKACRQLVDAFFQKSKECEVDVERTNIPIRFGVSRCEWVKKVRDKEALYQECIPAIKDLSCDNDPENTPGIPDSCFNQFTEEVPADVSNSNGGSEGDSTDNSPDTVPTDTNSDT